MTLYNTIIYAISRSRLNVFKYHRFDQYWKILTLAESFEKNVHLNDDSKVISILDFWDEMLNPAGNLKGNNTSEFNFVK